MAITLSQDKGKQRYMLLILVLAVFASLFILWFGFVRDRQALVPAMAPAVVYPVPKVVIDWQILDGLRLQKTQPFEEVSAFEGNFGRKNPFTPY